MWCKCVITGLVECDGDECDGGAAVVVAVVLCAAVWFSGCANAREGESGLREDGQRVLVCAVHHVCYC